MNESDTQKSNVPRRRGNPNWIPGGPSPNPGGSKPLTAEQRLAREIIHGDAPENALWMIKTRNNPNAPWDIRMACAARLDDREHGKAPQAVAVAGGLQISVIPAPGRIIEHEPNNVET